MTPQLARPRRSMGAILAAFALTVALPASTLGGGAPHPNPSTAFLTFTAAVTDPLADIIPLINSGEDPFVDDDDIFQGIPDGLGAVPGPDGSGYIDIYVAHEQSHVPFAGIPLDSTRYADYEDSSVTRVRVDIASTAVIEMETQLIPGAIPGGAGFLRFCSATMVGPDQGFDHYTFLVNEESNEDILDVPPGAVYGPDPSLNGHRQAGYSVWLDTETGTYDVISRAGRHNHENTVVVPGGWSELAILSGDDTFTAPGSQLYLYTAKDDDAVMADKGQLWAFQVTATDAGPVDPFNAQNDANDFLEITNNESAPWQGRFIHVPTDIARGVTGEAPQSALENWSNANNVFQFVRVEDLGYDPDNPRVVYFADTGTTRLAEDSGSGRLVRLGSGGTTSNGRIFKMVLNARDPRIVDEFSVLTDSLPVPPGGNAGLGVAFVNPDNLAVGENSIMMQEDAATANDVWQYPLPSGPWVKVASVVGSGVSAESSGIVRLEDTAFGAGWWALDVQGHQNLAGSVQSGFVWIGPPSSATGAYSKRIEEGQLLLMFIPGS